MAEKKSQENATKAIETAICVNDKESTVESAIDVDGPSSETESAILSRTKQHRESIENIIVSQYIDDQNVNDNNYAVTYSESDNSFLGWTINIEENEQQSDVYFNLNLDQSCLIGISELHRKTLIFDYYYKDERKYLL